MVIVNIIHVELCSPITIFAFPDVLCTLVSYSPYHVHLCVHRYIVAALWMPEFV